MKPQCASRTGRTLGIVCTVLGGALMLWVITRFFSVFGQQQTWAPPFASYEWTTLAGAALAAGLLIVGLVRLTRPDDHTEPSGSKPARYDRANESQ